MLKKISFSKYISKIFSFRKLFINFSFRSFANLLSKAMGLITLPIIARALGPTGYGEFNLIGLIGTYTTMPIGTLGFRSYGIREIAANRKNDEYAMNVLSMQFSVALISVIISSIISYIIFKNNLFLYLSIIIGYLSVFADSLNLEFFYVAKKDLVFPTVARLVGQGIFVIGVVLLIKNPNDVPVLVFLSAFTLVVSDFIQLRKYQSKYNKIKILFTLKEAFRTFKTTYKLGVAQNLENLYSSIPQLLIPIFLGTYALGIFSGGYKIFTILVMFYVTLFYALAPYLVKLNSFAYRTRRKYHMFMASIIALFSITFGLILFSFGGPILNIILGKSFSESVLIFKVISLTLIPLTPLHMLLLNILIYSDNDKYYLYCMLVSTITVLVTSTFLINNFGAVGGVYSMAIGLTASIIIGFYFYLRTSKSH